VYGPYGLFVTSIVEAARSRGVFTMLDEGRGICNAVYVDDVCDAILAAIETTQGVGSAFFINADSAVTWREFNLAFAQMVVPAPRITNLSRRYWASQRPTLKSDITALAPSRNIRRAPPTSLLGSDAAYAHHRRKANRQECSTERAPNCTEGQQGGTTGA
jgi:nucleoside-diphosphate-sugar epimerase